MNESMYYLCIEGELDSTHLVVQSAEVKGVRRYLRVAEVSLEQSGQLAVGLREQHVLCCVVEGIGEELTFVEEIERVQRVVQPSTRAIHDAVGATVRHRRVQKGTPSCDAPKVLVGRVQNLGRAQIDRTRLHIFKTGSRVHPRS